MINVLVAETYAGLVPPETLEHTAQATLAHEQASDQSDLTVVIDDDSRLQALNKEFLGIDAPTDVLSFPAGGDEVDPETGHAYLGDVIISYPRAQEQAAAAGHEVLDEVRLLVVHGVLHLLGFDHAKPEEKAAMWATQGEIIQALGVKINRLPE